MINIDFFVLKSGLLLGFDIYGHAECDVLGKDIVCAAVSSAAFMVANTISEVIKIPADVKVYDCGEMRLKVNEKDAALCSDVLLGFKLHMVNLEEQYPKNISVNYVEV